MTCAPSEDPGQPGHPPSLIITVRRKITGSLATQKAHSEDSDQTGRMPRLILVFAGRTATLLVLSGCDSDQTIFHRHNLDPTAHSPMSILIISFVLQQPLHTYARTHTHRFSCKFLVLFKFLVQMQQTSKTIPLLTSFETMTYKVYRSLFESKKIYINII